MKQRLEATHFIEVYKTKDEEIVNDNPHKISRLQDCLNFTNLVLKWQTIAIWNIKYK